jgi:hypothetical protein
MSNTTVSHSGVGRTPQPTANSTMIAAKAIAA